jgi:type IV secretory pathway VirB2 component (pilin)
MIKSAKTRLSNLYHNTGARLAVALATAAAAVPAHAQTSPWDQFFDAVDMSGVNTKVIAAGLLIIGIAVAFKGPDLAKRVVRKV